jgi:hypothetical protein
MATKEFKYDFEFETIVDTEDIPVGRSMRVNVGRLSHDTLEMAVQHDDENFGVAVYLSITDDGKMKVEIVAQKDEYKDGKYILNSVWKPISEVTVDSEGNAETCSP